jgi:formylglycine-generating enzyme required for sulfatase activity
MGFDLERWKEQLREPLRRFSDDPKGALRRAGAQTLFGYVATMTLFPLAVAAAEGELIPVVVALGSIAGSVGGNLIANKVQRWKDEATAIEELERELPRSPELRQALDQILSKLGVIEDAQRQMEEDERRSFASQLDREVQPYQADLSRVYATLTGVSESVVVFSERDTYVNYVTFIVNQLALPGLSDAELREATDRYLQYFVDRYQYLDLKGMGISERVAIRLPLLGMYIPLQARAGVPGGETWPQELRLAGRELRGQGKEDVVPGLREPQPVLDLMRGNDGLIILGDPGAGKTTFLKYLALKLARGEGEELGLGPSLPVLVPLSAYATALAEKDVRLDAFIADYFRERVADLPIDEMLKAALEQGGALVLLDGLDEVREPSLRHTVVQRVLDFYSFHRRAGNRFALTSRIVGYREVCPTAEGLVDCTLVDFGDEEIEAFVDKWTAAIERAARGETGFALGEAQRERGELLEAIERNPGVRGLASNPLLLTILALMKRQGVRLPDRRVQLYDKYVETLLSSWNLARGLGRPPTRDLDLVQTVRVLAPLALWMHEQSPGVGLVKQEELKRKLAEIYGQQGEADLQRAVAQFLDDVHDYAGMLLERGAGQYGFIHLTFEEYLAAVGLARLGQGSIEPVVQLLSEHVGDPAWREVALLTIGHLGIVQQWEEVASAVVGELLERQPGEPGEAVVLMGDAVVDASPGGVTLACKEKVVDVLLGTMRDKGVKAPLRAGAGRTLAKLGDPRPEVMTIEGMQFCHVPPGPFWMGSGDDPLAWEREKPARQVDIPYGYWMGRYPVSNAQFRLFSEDPEGYQADGWWTKSGLEWRGNRSGRAARGDPVHLPNYPVIVVTWYETVAFAGWLEHLLGDTGVLPGGWVVRLPSEAEWEKAARGGLEIDSAPLIESAPEGLGARVGAKVTENPGPQRRYPWGDDPDPDKANYRETGIHLSSAMGCFGPGASPYGVEELSGNVLEWCATKRHDSYTDYPDDNALEGDAPRVVRGGSFYESQRDVRCACRNWNLPGSLDDFFGFRVVVTPGPPSQF